VIGKWWWLFITIFASSLFGETTNVLRWSIPVPWIAFLHLNRVKSVDHEMLKRNTKKKKKEKKNCRKCKFRKVQVLFGYLCESKLGHIKAITLIQVLIWGFEELWKWSWSIRGKSRQISGRWGWWLFYWMERGQLERLCCSFTNTFFTDISKHSIFSASGKFCHTRLDGIEIVKLKFKFLKRPANIYIVG
jgi:hypothetical protein